jgi:hypothetical protein
MLSDSALFSLQFVSFALEIQYSWEHIGSQLKQNVLFFMIFMEKKNELYLLLSYEGYFSGKPRLLSFYRGYFLVTAQEEILIIFENKSLTTLLKIKHSQGGYSTKCSIL